MPSDPSNGLSPTDSLPAERTHRSADDVHATAGRQLRSVDDPTAAEEETAHSGCNPFGRSHLQHRRLTNTENLHSVTPAPQSTLQPVPNGNPAPAHSRGVTFMLKSSTWLSASHGLFDYETRSTAHKTFKCRGLYESYRVVRAGKDVQLMDDVSARLSMRSSTVTMRTLAKIVWKAGRYYVLPGCCVEDRDIQKGIAKPEESYTINRQDKLWLVVRALPEHCIRIVKGDVVKFGRFEVKVRDLVVTKEEAEQAHRERRWETFLQSSQRSGRPFGAGPSTSDESPISPPSSPAVPAACPAGGVPDMPCTPRDANGMASPTESPPEDVTEEIGSETASPLLPVRSRSRGSSSQHTNIDGSHSSDQSVDAPSDEHVTAMVSQLTSFAQSICRICLGEDEDDVSNPLITPCDCKGSLAYVHLDCLRMWMRGRIDVKTDGPTPCFQWRALHCELCKAPYPKFVDVPKPLGVGGFEAVELFALPKLEVPYIVLEPRDRKGEKSVHFLSLARLTQARMGRGHDAEIRLPDISVSRVHSLMKFVWPPCTRAIQQYSRRILGDEEALDGFFFVEDHVSKFGTLLRVERPLPFDPGVQICLQIGKTVCFLSARRDRRIFPQCLKFHHRKSSDNNDIAVLQSVTQRDSFLSRHANSHTGSSPHPHRSSAPATPGNNPAT